MVFNSVKKRIISFLLAIAVFLSGINFPNIASLAEQETTETGGDTSALVWVEDNTEDSAEPEEPSAAAEEGSAVEDGSGATELPASGEETAPDSEEGMTEASGEETGAVSEEETAAVSEEETTAAAEEETTAAAEEETTAAAEEETTAVAEEETTAAAEEETMAAAEEETTAVAEEESTAAAGEETTAAAEEEATSAAEEETDDDKEDGSGDVSEEETEPVSDVTVEREKTEREDLETDNFTGLTAEKEVILENLDTHYVTVSDALTAVDDVCLDITVADPGLIETENLEAEEAGEDIFVLAHSESTLRFYAGAGEDAYYVAALNPYVEVAPASLSLTHKEEHDTVYDSSSLIYDAVTGLVYLRKSLADAHYQELRLSVYYLVAEDEEPVDAAEAFITSFLTDDSVVEPGDPVAVSGNLTDETVVLDLYEYLKDGLNESMLTVYVNGYSEPLTEEEFSYGNAMLTVNLTPFAVRDLVVEVNTGDETLGRENLADVERGEITEEQETLTESGNAQEYVGDVPPATADLPDGNAFTEAEMQSVVGIHYYSVVPEPGDPFYTEYPDAKGYIVLGVEGAAEQEPEYAVQHCYGYYNGTSPHLGLKPFVAVWNNQERDWDYYPVYKVGAYCFSTSATTVGTYTMSLPDTIVEIEDNAFNECMIPFAEDGPGRCTIPAGVRKIGNNAFLNAANVGEILIKGENVSIGDHAFEGCSSLYAVSGNPNGTNSNSWASEIGAFAFRGTNIGADSNRPFVIPGSVIRIAESAFAGMTRLNNITFDTGSESLTIPANAFSGEGASSTPLKHVTVKRSSLNIAESAFYGISNLNSLVLVNDEVNGIYPYIKSIGAQAFRGTALETLTLPAEIESIGEYAFDEIKTLASFKVEAADEHHAAPSAPLTIGDYAFCQAFKQSENASSVEINVPAVLGEAGFAANPGIGSLELNSTNITVGDSAFAGVGSANYPLGTAETPLDLSGVVSFGVSAFEGSFLGAVMLPETLDCDSSLGANAFNNASLQTVELPSGWTGTLPSGLFADNSNLTEVTFAAVPDGGADSGLSIADADDASVSPFAGCASLAEFKDYRTGTIGDSAFAGLVSLTEAEIPYVTAVGDYAFSGCTGISSLQMGAVTVVGEKAFYQAGDAATVDPAQVSVDLSGATVIGSRAFEASGLISGTVGNSGSEPLTIELPASGCSIGTYAFSKTAVESVNISGINIPEGLFKDCTELSELTLSAADIGTSAFGGCTGLTALYLTVGEIGGGAFSGCSGLETIELVLTGNVGDYAFESCTGLRSVTITGNNIGQYAFTGCTGEFTADITLTGSLGSSAFSNCSAKNLASAGITSLKLTAQTVGNAAFNKCTNLDSAELDVQQVSKFAFLDCSKLASLSMKPAVVGESAFKNCGPATADPALSSIDLSEAVSIDASAFEGCKLLGAVVLVRNMTLLGGAAFKGSSVSSVTLPENQPDSMPEGKADGTNYDGIFEGCASLTEITIPGGWACVPRGMFKNCSGLEAVTFADGTETIEIRPYAFFGTKIASLDLDRPGMIGESAFTGCSSLSSVQIPQVTVIGDHAFDNLTGLNKLDLGSGLGEGETLSIGAYAFRNAGSAEGLVINDADLHIDLTQIASVGDYAFSGCKLIRGDVTLLGDIIVGNYAFANSVFENLTVNGAQITNASVFSGASFGSLTVTDSAKLGASSFEGASLSGDVAISDSSIGAYAFKNAQIVGNVTVSNPSLAAHAFTGATFGGLMVNAPAEGVTTIGADAFASEGTLITTFKRLTVTGNGTVIGDRAFSGVCFSGAVYEEGEEQAEIKITGTNVSIGESAFSGCTGLHVADVHGAGSIGASAFAGCTELTAVNASGAAGIGASTFSGCSLLETVDIKNAVTIGNSAFSGCTSLTEIDARSATSIGDATFKNLTNLQKVNIHAAETVGESAFEGCTGIVELDMASVTSVGAKAFKNAGAEPEPPAVTTVVNASGESGSIDPSTIESIGEAAFFECKLIKGDIVLDLAKTTIGKNAFAKTSFGDLKLNNSPAEDETEPEEQSLTDGVFTGVRFGDFKIEGSRIKVGADVFNGAEFRSALISGDNNTLETYALSGAKIKDNTLTPAKGIITITGSGNMIGTDVGAAHGNVGAVVFDALVINGTNTLIEQEAFREADFASAEINGSGTEIGTKAFWSADFDTLNISTSSVTIGDFAFAKSEISTLKLPASEPGTMVTVTDPETGEQEQVNDALGKYIFMSCQNLTTDLTSETGFTIPAGYIAGVGYDGLEGLLLDGVIPNRADKAEINSSGSIVPAGWTYLPEGFFYDCDGIRFLYLKNIIEVADYVYCTEGDPSSSTAAYDSVNQRLYHTVVWFGSYLGKGAISAHAFQRENTDLGKPGRGRSYMEIYLKQNPYGTVDGYRNGWGWGSGQGDSNWIRWKESIASFGPEDIFYEPRIEYNHNGTPNTVISSQEYVDVGIFNYLGYYIVNPELANYSAKPGETQLTERLSETEGMEGFDPQIVPNVISKTQLMAEGNPAGEYSTSLVIAEFGPHGFITEENKAENSPVCYIKYYELIHLIRTNDRSQNKDDPIDEFDYRYALFRHPYYKENDDGSYSYAYYEERDLDDSDKTTIPGYWGESDLGMDWAQFIAVLNAQEKTDALGLTAGVPGQIGTIGTEAFKAEGENDKFTSIWIPKSITQICSYAFSGQELLGGTEQMGYGIPNLNVCTLSEGIGEYAFRGCSMLPEIHLNTVGNIGQKAFENCSRLTLFETGTAGTVGTYAFTGCSSLEEVRFTGTETSVADIGDHAFAGCSSLETVTAAGSVGSIGTGAFSNCSSLETFMAEGAVGNIGSQAFISSFVDCGGHGTVTFKAGAGNIGDYAFSGCTGLEKVTVGYMDGDDGFVAANIGNIGEYAFSKCGVEIPACSSLREFRAANTGNINKAAFLNCGNLETFTVMSEGIPGTIGQIGTYAFGHCGKLRNFKAGTVASIGTLAFEYCFNDASYERCAVEIGAISGTGICIGEKAFIGCGQLTDVTIGTIGAAGNPGSIGNGAFNNCAALENFTVGTSDTYGPVADLGGQNNTIGVFEGCGKLKNVNVSSIDNIGAYAFFGCAKLGSENTDGKKEFTIRSFSGDSEGKGLVGKYAFTGCDFQVFKVDNGTVRQFDNYAFAAGPVGKANVGACELLERVQVSKVLSIQKGVFQACVSLTEIDIDEIGTVGGTAIGASAFENCDALTTVRLKKVNGTVGQRAFAECNELASFTILAGTVTELGGNAAAGNTDSIFYNCPNLTTIIFGDSTTPDTVSCNVETISKNAFRGQNTLQTVYFEQVGTVGESAFKECVSLKDVQLNGAVSVDDKAFQNTGTAYGSTVWTGDNAYPGMTIPQTLAAIGEYAFDNCRLFTEVNLNAKTGGGSNVVTSVKSYAFRNCVNVTSVTLPDTRPGSYTESSFGINVFENCTYLPEAEIPTGWTKAPQGIFKGCSCLKDVKFPSALRTIEKEAFCKTASFPGITDIPGIIWDGNGGWWQIVTIGLGAFNESKLVGAVDFQGSGQGTTRVTRMSTIGESAFENSSVTSLILPDAEPEEMCAGNLKSAERLNQFKNCKLLTGTITIPAGWDCVSEGMFSGANLDTLLVSGQEGTKLTIRKSAFSDCGRLDDITINGLTDIEADTAENGAFHQCGTGSSVDFVKLVIDAHPAGYPAADDTQMGTVSEHAFSGCSKLSDVTLNYVEVNANAFKNCFSDGGLENRTNTVTVRENAKFNGAVFESCGLLDEVTVEKAAFTSSDAPASAVFHNCSRLGQVTVTEAADFTGSPFNGCAALKKILVSPGVADRENATKFIGNNRSSFGILTGAGESWGEDTGIELVVEGEAQFADYAFATSPKLYSVTMNDVTKLGISNSGAYAFYKSGIVNLSADKLESVPKGAFQSNKKLQSIDLPECLTIGEAAFLDAIRLTSVIADKCTKIDKSAFYNNPGLVTVSADAVTQIGEYAFYGCTSLVGKTVPGENYTALYFPALKTLGVKPSASADNKVDGNGKWTINRYETCSSHSFEGCTSLQRVEMPVIEIIGADAFRGCSGLEFFNKTEEQKIRDRNNQPIYNSGRDLYHEEETEEGNEEILLDMSKLPRTLHYLGANAFNGTGMYSVYVIPNWPLNSEGTQQWWPEAGQPAVVLSYGEEEKWTGKPFFAADAFEGLGEGLNDPDLIPYVFIQMDHDSIKGSPWTTGTDVSVDWHDCIMYDRNSNLWYKYNDSVDGEKVVSIIQSGSREDVAYVIPDSLPDGMGNSRKVRKIGSGSSGDGSSTFFTNCFIFAENDLDYVRIVLNDQIAEIVAGALNGVDDIQIPQYPGDGPLDEDDIFRAMVPDGQPVPENKDDLRSKIVWLEKPALKLQFSKRLVGTSEIPTEDVFVFRMAYEYGSNTVPANYEYSSANLNGFRTQAIQVSTAAENVWSVDNETESRMAELAFAQTQYERGNRGSDGSYDGKYIAASYTVENGNRIYDPDTNNDQYYIYKITEPESEGGDYEYFSNIPENEEKERYVKVTFTRVTDPSNPDFSINYTVQPVWYSDGNCTSGNETDNIIENTYYAPVRLIYNLNLDAIPGYTPRFEEGMLEEISVSYAQPAVIQRGSPAIVNAQNERDYSEYVFAGWSTRREPSNPYAKTFGAEEKLLKPERTEIGKVRFTSDQGEECGYLITNNNIVTLYAVWEKVENQPIYTRYGSDVLYNEDGTVMGDLNMPNRYGYKLGTGDIESFGFRIDNNDVQGDYQVIDQNGEFYPTLPDDDIDPDDYENDFLIYVDRKWRWGLKKEAGIADPGKSGKSLKAYWTRDPAKLAKLILKREVTVDGARNWVEVGEVNGKAGYVAYNNPYVYNLNAEEYEEFDIAQTEGGTVGSFFTSAVPVGATNGNGSFLGWYTAAEGGTKILNPDGTFAMEDGVNEIPGWVIRVEDGTVRWMIANTEEGVYDPPTERVLYAHFGNE